MAEQSPRYKKRLLDQDEKHNPLDSAESDQPLALRVSLGEMGLEDAFYTPLPSSFVRLSLGEVIDRVFPDDPHGDLEGASLDLRANPDLTEMYEALLTIFRVWKRGGCALRFFVNDGPEIAGEEPLSTHLELYRSGLRLLDLVIEQRFTTLDYAVARGYWGTRDELEEWLQGLTLLYFFAHSDQADQSVTELEGALDGIGAGLEERRLLERSENDGIRRVSLDGRKELESLRREAESYAQRYDVFRDVLYDREAVIEFESGLGRDLRADVVEAEGLDPVRTMFLSLLWEDAIQEVLGDGLQPVLDEDFFDSFLAPSVPSSGLDAVSIEAIIESGLTYSEEREEEKQRHAKRRELLDRVKQT